MAAILITRFSGRPLQEICAMGGITLEDLHNSSAYREIFGQGLQEGRLEGELELTKRQLQRRCGQRSSAQQTRIRELSLPQLETLAEALLDFQGPADLDTWLDGNGPAPQS